MTNVSLVKFALLVGILLMGLCSVFAPRRLAGSPSLFSLGNMMASGVLLAAALVHQLADASKNLDKPGEFPWAMFISGLTFLMFMVTEESLHLIFEEQGSNEETVLGLNHSHDHANGHSKESSLPERQPLLPRDSVDSCSIHDCRRSSQIGEWLQSGKSNLEDSLMMTEHHHHNSHIDLHLHSSVLATFILMMALSVHSVLAGVAIGIATSMETIAPIAVAILAHKSFEGFCLGSNLVNSNLDHGPFVILGVTFALSTPLGIVIGQFIIYFWGTHSNEASSTMGIVQAVVAGAFLYISIIEIASKETLVCRHDSRDSHSPSEYKSVGVCKLFCFVLGYVAMSYLGLYV